jgi:hypothetical protein
VREGRLRQPKLYCAACETNWHHETGWRQQGGGAATEGLVERCRCCMQSLKNG